MSFAEINGCAAADGWHVCQSWELTHLYMNRVSTGDCDMDTGYEGDGPDICMGWTIGPVSELGNAGDCYGYSSDASDEYHSSIWYIEQWGIATCDSDMPVLCCQ